ncbi:MAG TPA: copper chaperone PCu(A)C, partial [Roseiarcus sp.]|nr:copper chaperone PCu(A)C [Roseiarcus sp.]
LTLLLVMAATPALAQIFSAGDIVIEAPWARATPKGAPVGAGYMTIRNNGATPDKLTGGSADFASEVQIHEMAMNGGVMTMRRLPDGLTIPPNSSVTLKPKDYHLMFQGLKQPLTKGETVKATLTFEHAGSIPIDLRVESVGAMGPGDKPAPDQMKGMKMD